jgi:hypothetical protein
MQTTVPTQTEKTLDRDSLLLASFILTDVKQTIEGVHTIVTALLRYATIGAWITTCLVESIAPMAADEPL